MKVEELGMQDRTWHALKRAGIYTVEQLREKTDEQLLEIRFLGARALGEIRQKVAELDTVTNADRIRAMSDEELADTVMCPNEIYKADVVECSKPMRCVECCLRWLKQPAPMKEG